MAQDLFQYDKMIERALRGVVRDALARAAREGLPGAHHFYIGFATAEPGVSSRHPARQIPGRDDDRPAAPVLGSGDRRRRVFGDAELSETARAADRPVCGDQELCRPVGQFRARIRRPGGKAAKPAAALPSRSNAAETGGQAARAAEKPTGEVVTLDSFRKRYPRSSSRAKRRNPSPRRLPDRDCRVPFFSPCGRWLAMIAKMSLALIPGGWRHGVVEPLREPLPVRPGRGAGPGRIGARQPAEQILRPEDRRPAL